MNAIHGLDPWQKINGDVETIHSPYASRTYRDGKSSKYEPKTVACAPWARLIQRSFHTSTFILFLSHKILNKSSFLYTRFSISISAFLIWIWESRLDFHRPRSPLHASPLYFISFPCSLRFSFSSSFSSALSLFSSLSKL